MIRRVNTPLFLSIRLVLKFVIKPILFIIKRYRVIGAGNLPRKRQPCIIICNHAAFIDSVYIICSMRPRFTICGAKPKYFEILRKRLVLRLANVMQVSDHRQFLNDCGKLLQAGEVILIYPEMGRYPRGLNEFKSWAAEVAVHNRVPVIPCYIYGTSSGHMGKKKLVVGEPITPAGTPDELTLRFYQAIAALQKRCLAGE